MRAPSKRFWRHTVSIVRKTMAADASLSAAPVDGAPQSVACAVHEPLVDPQNAETSYAIESIRRFDVLIPRLHPTTGLEQFPAATYPAGPAIKRDDTLLWGTRILRVMIDVDTRGRGGHDHIYTVCCREIV